MRHALIIAGGSGTRLWPMSRASLPKQLIPFINGKSLLQIAMDRLEGLVPPERQFICAGEAHREVILQRIEGMTPDRYLAEPCGRDTLNAVGFASAAIAKRDPEAVIAVFTADHVIEPADEFRRIVERGFEVAEQTDNALVTFGIEPTRAATGYGYLKLGEEIPAAPDAANARTVEQFKEKPDETTAKGYLDAGPSHYLWNSGMFVWKASTLLGCIEKHAPQNYAGLKQIMDALGQSNEAETIAQVYPRLPKISVDYAVMEPASQDAAYTVAAIPMPLKWLDVGSWTSFCEVCERDEQANALAAKHLLMDTQNTLVASDEDDHVIATIGCEDLLIVHTAEATLVCRRDDAEKIKALHKAVGEKFGEGLL